ncbi:MAG TPA: hypothetical protein DCR97_06620 [Deltaproteobacteria bacterium]|nr:hypothetical protein [Deltaproteobacteria bacterium]
MIFLILALLLLFSVMVLTVVLQCRRSMRQYRRLAEALCDPGSWRIRFLIRTVVLVGKVDGLPIRYSVLGSPKAQAISVSYLLLLCPVRRNLRVYAESDLCQAEEGIREELEALQKTEGFRNVILTPGESPFLGKVLSRPLGLTYAPGILLCRLEEAGAFNAGTVRSDIRHLVALCKKSM